MSDVTVSRSYAQAMIEVAAEANVVDPVREDLVAFLGLLDEHADLLKNALYNPVFTAEERAGVLDALLPRLGLNPLTNNLLRLLNDKGRMPALEGIVEAYTDLADLRSGRVRVRVETATALDAAMEAEVRDALAKATGKAVILQTTVDPSLLGGLVARVGGKVYDSSIRSRLQRIQQDLTSSQLPAQA